MVELFCEIPPIFLRSHQGSTPSQVEKKIVKNLNQQGLQPPIHIYPPHHHDLEGVDILNSGCSWNLVGITKMVYFGKKVHV